MYKAIIKLNNDPLVRLEWHPVTPNEIRINTYTQSFGTIIPFWNVLWKLYCYY
jgi:hypothetical protein